MTVIIISKQIKSLLAYLKFIHTIFSHVHTFRYYVPPENRTGPA